MSRSSPVPSPTLCLRRPGSAEGETSQRPHWEENDTEAVRLWQPHTIADQCNCYPDACLPANERKCEADYVVVEGDGWSLLGKTTAEWLDLLRICPSPPYAVPDGDICLIPTALRRHWEGDHEGPRAETACRRDSHSGSAAFAPHPIQSAPGDRQTDLRADWCRYLRGSARLAVHLVISLGCGTWTRWWRSRVHRQAEGEPVDSARTIPSDLDWQASLRAERQQSLQQAGPEVGIPSNTTCGGQPSFFITQRDWISISDSCLALRRRRSCSSVWSVTYWRRAKESSTSWTTLSERIADTREAVKIKLRKMSWYRWGSNPWPSD